MPDVVHPGSAIGEAIGNLIEERILHAAEEVATPHHHFARRGRMRNGQGSMHQIDVVVEDSGHNPVILIEPKYLRYTKHNWDKASRLWAAHYNLKKTFDTIRMSMAVLAGNWTDTSVNFLRNFGVEIHRIPFSTIVTTLAEYDIVFNWSEHDNIAPRTAWNLFEQLEHSEKEDIANALTSGVISGVKSSVEHIITLDPNAPRVINELEILLRTGQGEFFVKNFSNAPDAIRYLLSLTQDRQDLQKILR